MQKNGRLAARILTYLIMIVLFLVAVYPIIWLIAGSFKDDYEFYNNIWGFASKFRVENYISAWNRAGLGAKYINSLLVTCGFLLVLLPVVCCAAYAIARLEFRGKKAIYTYFLIGIMIPTGVLAIPSFSLAVKLGLVNSRIGLILFYVAQSTAFGIFLMRSFFISLPKSLEEAALIDGSTRFGSFIRVILPLSLPGIMTQVIYSGLNVWNEYLLASVFIRTPEKQTLPLGMATFVNQYNIYYPELFAALVCVTLPMVIIYILGQKTFISGMTAGAVKG